MGAAPSALELPAVVRALESPTCDYTAERQRHVAMRAAIEERSGPAILPTKKHQRHPQHVARERAVLQIGALTRDVPKAREPRDRDVPLGFWRNQFFEQHRESGS